MKNSKCKLLHYVANTLVAVMFFLSYGHQLAAQNPVYNYHPTEKKLLVLQCSGYYDWSSDLATNLTTMQSNRPYVDGVCFHNGLDYGMPQFAFNNEVWTTSSLRFSELQTIATKWTTLTDNFILVWGHSRNVDANFFDDALWTKIIANAHLLGEAVATAGCKGIMFDPEFYSGGSTYSPWWYTVPSNNPTHVGTPPYVAAGYTFAQAKAKAKQRGTEYVQALQVHMPNITIMTTFLYEYIWEYCYGNINNLSGSHYALLSGFADGMLAGLNPGSVIVDGNETSYYYESTPAYDNDVANGQSYSYLRLTGIPAVCDPTLLSKWNSQGQIAMAPYIDYYNNNSDWIKHNVFNSLLTTDQYTWVYMESFNFWTGASAPPNALSAISSASNLFKAGNALGFDMVSKTSFPSTPTVTITSSSNNTPGSITINATVNPTTSISKVEFYANSQKIGEDATSPYSITKSFLSADYTVYARVYTAAGKHNTSSPKILTKGTSSDTQAPSAPASLVSSAITQTSFTLSWTASTDNVGVTGYEVFAGTESKGTTTATSLSITGLNCNTTYAMTVKACDAAGNWSNASTPLNVSTSTVCSPTVIITARGEYPSGGNTKDKAYNGILTDKWADPSRTTWIQFQFSSPIVYTSYAMTSAPDLPTRDPKTWTLEGSNNGTTWTTLSSQSNQTFASRGLTKTYTFTNTTAYTYYKLNVTANNRDNSFTQLAEISFSSTKSATIETGVGDIIEKEVIVFPNPSNSKITVSNIPENSIIFVSTIDGKMIEKIQTNNSTINFDVTHWNKGMYLFKIQSESEVIVKKVLVK